jgi:PadR family transcriptional regulator, regulatory protein PadR
MSDTTEPLPGTFDLVILEAVTVGPLRGYAVLLRIQQISQNVTEDAWGWSRA